MVFGNVADLEFQGATGNGVRTANPAVLGFWRFSNIDQCRPLLLRELPAAPLAARTRSLTDMTVWVIVFS